MERSPAIYPLFYAGNIAYYRSILTQEQEVLFEKHERFPKQTYRNRLVIIGPNGIQKLIIPVQKTDERTMNALQISYAENWRKDHWKGLEAAYRRSPYFEFYAHELYPFYHGDKIAHLWDFNWNLATTIADLLDLDWPQRSSTSHTEEAALDFRSHPFKTEDYPSYLQVFSDRHSFAPNLSILDALFNLGPASKDYLLKG